MQQGPYTNHIYGSKNTDNGFMSGTIALHLLPYISYNSLCKASKHATEVIFYCNFKNAFLQDKCQECISN